MELLKTSIREVKRGEQQIKLVEFNTQAQEFYGKLREEQMKVINEGHDNKFDSLYKHLLEPFRKQMNEEYLQLIDQGVKTQSTSLQKKLGQFIKVITQMNQVDLTTDELSEIEKRHKIDEEEKKHLANFDLPELEQRFMEFMMQDQK